MKVGGVRTWGGGPTNTPKGIQGNDNITLPGPRPLEIMKPCPFVMS